MSKCRAKEVEKAFAQLNGKWNDNYDMAGYDLIGNIIWWNSQGLGVTIQGLASSFSKVEFMKLKEVSLNASLKPLEIKKEKSNAHLIAAAPDLYRALEKIAKQHRKHYGLDGAWDSVLSNAEQALAKARGEL